MSDPYRLLHIRKLTCHRKNILIRMTGKLNMLLLVNLLDIQHYKICILHKFQPFGMPRFLLSKRISTGVKIRMHALCFCFLKKLCKKIYLKQWLTTTYSDTAFITPVTLITQSFLQKLICSIKLTLVHLPGIRIMAELASHGTAA